MHKCKDCKYFVKIRGRKETKYGCIINIQEYRVRERRIPDVLPAFEVMKWVGIEGLNECVSHGNPDANCCAGFELKLKSRD